MLDTSIHGTCLGEAFVHTTARNGNQIGRATNKYGSLKAYTALQGEKEQLRRNQIIKKMRKEMGQAHSSDSDDSPEYPVEDSEVYGGD